MRSACTTEMLAGTSSSGRSRNSPVTTISSSGGCASARAAVKDNSKRPVLDARTLICDWLFDMARSDLAR